MKSKLHIITQLLLCLLVQQGAYAQNTSTRGLTENFGDVGVRSVITGQQQRTLKEYSELAILRLMNAIKETDYARFYTYLEKDGNKVIKHLVSEMDDASIYFWIDKDNYTNFIGALVTMFQKAPDAIENRWPNNAEDLAKRVVNLNPIKYENNIPDTTVPYSTKHNEGSYDETSGNIYINDVYTTTYYYGREKMRKEKRKNITVLSPLTPVIIVPEADKRHLVATALDAESEAEQNLYIVPAIFFKYKADKIRNDHIKTAGNIAMTLIPLLGQASKIAQIVRIGKVGKIKDLLTGLSKLTKGKKVGVIKGAKGAPKSTPKFKTPTNPPQLPPSTVPEGMTIRIMKPTQQYPNGYWRLEKPMPQGGAQGINPATMKPGALHETHVPLPPGYWKK